MYVCVCVCWQYLWQFVLHAGPENLWQWGSFSLQWSFWHVCLEQTHMSQLHISPKDQEKGPREIERETLRRWCSSVRWCHFSSLSSQTTVTSPVLSPQLSIGLSKDMRNSSWLHSFPLILCALSSPHSVCSFRNLWPILTLYLLSALATLSYSGLN